MLKPWQRLTYVRNLHSKRLVLHVLEYFIVYLSRGKLHSNDKNTTDIFICICFVIVFSAR